MRLGWTKNKNSITYHAVKTIRVDGKNQTMVIKTFGSDKFIRETSGVTDAKAWAKEQVRLMNKAEQDETPSFHITLCSGTLTLNCRTRESSTAGTSSSRISTMNWGWIRSAPRSVQGMGLTIT